MRRKSALFGLAALSGMVGMHRSASATSGADAGLVDSVPNFGKPLHPPAHGLPRVAVVVGPDLVPIDAIGPMTAFGDTMVASREMKPFFEVYTVAPNKTMVDAGVKFQADYTFANAPQPHVLVVPAQKPLPATVEYIAHAAKRADVVMSVCTGAFVLGKTGLFDGGRATTHHDGWDDFEKFFPKVRLIRGPRYVEDPHVSSSAGESSGIDLALRVVERYYGRHVANAAAYNMEYRRTRVPRSIDDV